MLRGELTAGEVPDRVRTSFFDSWAEVLAEAGNPFVPPSSMSAPKHSWLVPIAMVVGLVVGLSLNVALSGEMGGVMDIFIRISKAIGSTVFIGLLKLLVIPLIFSTIFLVVANGSSSKGFGRSLRMVLLYYVATSTIAVTISLTLANALAPGVGPDGPILEGMLELEDEVKVDKGTDISASTVAYGGGLMGVVETFLKQLIPDNVFAVLSTNRGLLGTIFVAGLFGFAAARVPQARETLAPVMEAVKGVIQWLIEAVLRIAPLGVFCLAFASSSVFGLDLLKTVSVYFVGVVLALLIHAGVVLLPSLWLLAKLSPAEFLGGMREALVTAFSTSSSAATLPVTTRCLNANLKVSDRSTSMVLPMGATVNMDGTALYECFAVLFVAQGLGYDLSLGAQVVVVILAIATSIGVAPVPSASLVAIALILENVGVPGSAAAIGLLYAIDRPLDMMRTAVNVMGDSVGAVLHDRVWGKQPASASA